MLDRFSNALYMQLHETRILCRVLPGGQTFDTATLPEFPQEKFAAAFQHPRLIIADFVAAEFTLNHVIRLACSRTLVKPTVVLQLLHPFSNDITPTETRALLEVLERAGARRVWLWRGRELTDSEIITRTLPPEGWRYSDGDSF